MPQGIQGDTLAAGSLGLGDPDDKGANDMTQSTNVKSDITQNTDFKPVPQPDVEMKVKVDMANETILEKK